MTLWLQDIYIWLEFSAERSKLLVKEQGLDNPERLRVINKNVNDICNVMRKPGGKNANGTPDRQQVSVIAQKILKLAAFLFHHRGRCTLDWEVLGVHEDSVSASRTEDA